MNPLMVIKAIRFISKLGAREKLVLVALVLRTDNKTIIAKVTHGLLAKDTSLSKRSVGRALDTLRERGLIDVYPQSKDGVQIANCYGLRLNARGLPDAESDDPR